MPPDITPAPPEATVIRLAREAMGITAQAAADATSGISAAYWRDVERGHGGRRGQRVPARASARVLAAMARTVGVEPHQLAEAGREDAARVLAEIQRREGAAPQPAPVTLQRGPGDAALPMDRQFQDQAEPHYTQIAGAVLRARSEHWELPPSAPLQGEWVFPGDPVSAAQWDSLAARGWSDWQLSWAMAALAGIEAEHDRTAARR